MMRLLAASLITLGAIAGVAGAAQVEVENLQPRYWGGNTVRPVIRVTDEGEGRPLHVTWTVVFADHVVEGEVRGITGPGAQEVSIDLPTVRARIRATLKVQLLRDKDLLARAECPLELFPVGTLTDLKDTFGNRSVGIVASQEVAQALSEAVPINWEALGSAAAVRRFKGRFVLVVAERPFDRRSDLASALLSRVEDGMNLACVGGITALTGDARQGPEPRPDSGKEARVLAPGHGLLANLRPGDLARWGRDGEVVQALPGLPAGGNYITVLDLPSDEAPRPLALEVRQGSGRILYCGLPVLEKLREEPVAEVVVANILRWGPEGAFPFQNPCGYFEEGSGLEDALEKLGVKFRSSGGEDADIVLGDESLLDPKRGTPMLDLLETGGTAVLFHLSAEGLESLNELLRSRWERDVRGEPPRLALEESDQSGIEGLEELGSHPLLAGVRPEDVRSLGQWAEGEKVLAVRAIGDEAHFRYLIGKGIIAKLERDGVRIVFWQAPLNEKDVAAQKRVLSSVLTNLGVRLEPPG